MSEFDELAATLAADTKLHFAAGFMLAIETVEMLANIAPSLPAGDAAQALREICEENGLAEAYRCLQALREELRERKKGQDERRV